MNGEDLFRGLNYVNAKFIDEAETVTELQGEKKMLSLRRPVLIAALIALLLMLVGCAVVYVLSMKEINIGQRQTYQDVFEYDPESGQAVAYLGYFRCCYHPNSYTHKLRFLDFQSLQS